MPSWLTSDQFTWADPFIALLFILLFAALLRSSPWRRGREQPVSNACRRRVNAAVERRDRR